MGAWDKCTQNAGPTNGFFSKSVKEVAEGGFKAELRAGEICGCFPMIASYCCSISEARDMYAACRGAGKRHSCVRCHNTYENSMMAGLGKSRAAAEMVDTRRKVGQKHGEAVSKDGRGHSTRRQEVQRETAALLSKQTLAECPSFLKNVFGDGGVLVEDIDSIFTLEPL